MAQVYSNRQINNAYETGTAYENPDKTIRLSEVQTKPQGSGSNYISIGKFVEKKDDFGDRVTEWHHYAYPKDFHEYAHFKFKSDWDGKGAQARISWVFIVPANFISDGWAIAIIGSGQGGRGYQKTDIDVILDADRENIIRQ